MNYFMSKDIKIFPTTNRGNYTINVGTSGSTTYGFDPEAELNTEFNYTHLIGRPGSKESFVIKWPGTDTDDKRLICVIKGYYFEISNFPKYITEDLKNQDLYLHIGLKELILNENKNPDVARSTYILGNLVSPNTSSLDQDQNKQYEDEQKNTWDYYEFQGLGYSTDGTEAVEGLQCFSLQVYKAGKAAWENQSFRNLEEGQGENAIQQVGAGTAQGKHSAIFGEGHDEVTGEHAFVAGAFSARPAEGDTELFTIGDGTKVDNKVQVSNAVQIVRTTSGTEIRVKRKTIFDDQTKFLKDVQIGTEENSKAVLKLYGTLAVNGDTRMIGDLAFDDEKGGKITNATFPETPVDDTDPVRLIDLNIDEEFFNALYS